VAGSQTWSRSELVVDIGGELVSALTCRGSSSTSTSQPKVGATVATMRSTSRPMTSTVATTARSDSAHQVRYLHEASTSTPLGASCSTSSGGLGASGAL
jgi:hypothetical protein